MRKSISSTILVIFLVVSSAFATETASIFAEISKDNHFGQALSALVQMNTQSGAPDSNIREIDTLLKSLKAQIQQQSADEKERIENLAIECTSSLEDLGTQVDNAKTQFDNQISEEQDLQDELKQKQSHIQNQEGEIEQERNDRVLYQGQITQASDIFNSNKANFDEAIAACEEAIRLLREITRTRSTSTVSFVQNGVMFVQLSQKFQKIKTLLEKGAEKSHNAFIQPIIDILMELGSSNKLDISSVNQIIELIEALLARLREGLREHETQHETTVTGLNKLIEDLDKQITTHSQQVQLDKERVQYITERLAQLSGLISIQQSLVTQLGTARDSKEGSCNFEQTNYKTEEAARESQLATIERLITYFESQVTSSSSNVRSSAFGN